MSRTEASQPRPAAAAPQAAPPIKLLQPQRGLLVLLLLIWAGWMGVLLWMYFTTLRVPAPAPVRPASGPTVALRR